MTLSSSDHSTTSETSCGDRAESSPWSRRPGALPAAGILVFSCVALALVGFCRPAVLDDIDASARARTLPEMRLDINRATTAEFEALPLVGPALSARITADRELNGPFHSIDDLTRVSGIGPRIVAIMEPHICMRPVTDG